MPSGLLSSAARMLGVRRGGERGVRGGAYGVVGVAGQRRVGVVSGHRGDARDEVQQGGRDDGRVHVDPGQVQGPAAGRLVELGARGVALLGPPCGVPAVPEEDVGCGVPVRERTDEAEGFGERAGAGEVESGQGQAGRGGVDVGVGERRGDQGALQVDDFVDAGGEGVGGPFGSHPGDMPAFDDHRGREGVGRAVDVSPAQQQGAVFGGALGGGALGHGTSLAPAGDRPARGSPSAPQTRGGRASYGVDRTTVVRVETPASVRILVSRCSSSSGVATRTLRM
ncbi:hypothetical protein SMICM17S_08454 [Streptomyces microflavus]